METIASERGRPVDVIGFDACLMNMIEVAYQLRGTAALMVGSQEIEPPEGWPYDRILAALADRPDIGAEDLARVIVRTYGEEHSKRRDIAITQSAIRLSSVERLAELVSRLSDGLRAGLGGAGFSGQVLLPAIRNVQKFRDQQYADLGHLATLLSGISAADLAGPAADVGRRLLNGEPNSSVVAATRAGRDVAGANGLSIYLPLIGPVSPLYQELEFARHCRWAGFLEAFAAN